MTSAELIAKFELYVDDGTELSTAEELSLLNKIYHKVCDDRPWEFLKKTATGTTSTTVPYIALPSDFGYIAENYSYTDDSVSTQINSAPKVIFVGTSYSPYYIINFSDRRQYLNKKGYAYVDIVNSRLVFTAQPTTAEAIEYDYIHIPTDLIISTSPIFPARFHDVIYHGMATDDYSIQQFDKSRSYADENTIKYNDYMKSMAYWNSQLLNN